MCLCDPGEGCPLQGHSVQVLLTIKNGAVVHQQLVHPDEWVMSIECFIDIARRAGWTVIPPVNTSEG